MIKNKIIFIFLFLLIIFNVYANVQYLAKQDIDVIKTIPSDNKEIIGKLKKGEKCIIKNNLDYPEYQNNECGIWVLIESSKIKGWILSNNLILDNKDAISEEFISLWTKFFILDANKEYNEEIIVKNESKEYQQAPNPYMFWRQYAYPKILINNVLLAHHQSMGGIVIYFENVKKLNKNHFLVQGQNASIDDFGAHLPEKIEIELILEGNRLKINSKSDFKWDNLSKINSQKDFNDINNFISKVMLQFYNYVTPTVPKLRLRSKPSVDGDFIKMLVKGENLKYLEKGKPETISGDRGFWVKVKTEDGTEGYCFDAFLTEVTQ